MTAAELQQAGVTLFGQRGWTTALAACLGIDRSSVHRYIHGQIAIPGPVAAAVTAWLQIYRSSGETPKPVE